MGHLKEWEQEMRKEGEGGGCEGHSCPTSCSVCISEAVVGPGWEICKETGGSTTAPDPVREEPLAAGG